MRACMSRKSYRITSDSGNGKRKRGSAHQELGAEESLGRPGTFSISRLLGPTQGFAAARVFVCSCYDRRALLQSAVLVNPTTAASGVVHPPLLLCQLTSNLNLSKIRKVEATVGVQTTVQLRILATLPENLVRGRFFFPFETLTGVDESVMSKCVRGSDPLGSLDSRKIASLPARTQLRGLTGSSLCSSSCCPTSLSVRSVRR